MQGQVRIVKMTTLKLSEIKTQVYQLTQTLTTQQFKTEHPEIHQNRDLRYKKNWAEILSQLLEKSPPISSDDTGPDTASASMDEIDAWLDGIAEADAKAEEKHRQMYYAMGSLLGWSAKQCDTRWARIQLQAQWEVEAEAKLPQ